MKIYIALSFLCFSIVFFNNYAAAAEYNTPDLERYGISDSSDYQALLSFIEENKSDYPYYILCFDETSRAENSTLADTFTPAKKKVLILSSEPFVFSSEIISGSSGDIYRICFNFSETAKYVSYNWTTSFSVHTRKSFTLGGTNCFFWQASSFLHDLSTWICFTNMTLNDTCENVPQFVAYTPTLYDSGKSYGSTGGDVEGETPEDESTGILSSIVSFVKSIGNSLNNLLASVNEFFSAFSDVFVQDLEFIFIPSWDGPLITNVYNEFNNNIIKSYPIVGQLKKLVSTLSDLDSYSPYAKYVKEDGQYYDGGANMETNAFKRPDFFSFKLPSSWSGTGTNQRNRTYNLLNTYNAEGYGVELNSALELANKFISCFLWCTYIWKMFKRSDSFLEPFKF